jgi:hypothetical protein
LKFLNLIERKILIFIYLFKFGQVSSNQITDSDVSADSSASSKFHIEKCFAKVRIAAVGVLLTAFQVSFRQIHSSSMCIHLLKKYYLIYV